MRRTPAGRIAATQTQRSAMYSRPSKSSTIVPRVFHDRTGLEDGTLIQIDVWWAYFAEIEGTIARFSPQTPQDILSSEVMVPQVGHTFTDRIAIDHKPGSHLLNFRRTSGRYETPLGET